MPITITTTSVVETLDDLTDALEALREISVDRLIISGDIDFSALAEARFGPIAAALAAQVQPECADLISRVPDEDLVPPELSDADERYVIGGDALAIACPNCGAPARTPCVLNHGITCVTRHTEAGRRAYAS